MLLLGSSSAYCPPPPPPSPLSNLTTTPFSFFHNVPKISSLISCAPPVPEKTFPPPPLSLFLLFDFHPSRAGEDECAVEGIGKRKKEGIFKQHFSRFSSPFAQDPPPKGIVTDSGDGQTEVILRITFSGLCLIGSCDWPFLSSSTFLSGYRRRISVLLSTEKHLKSKTCHRHRSKKKTNEEDKNLIY